MTLQFRQHTFPRFLARELEFDSFLSLFEQDFPLIPSLILEPLPKKAGLKHFSHLVALEKEIDLAEISLNKLVSKSKLIPNPSDVILALETSSLEQFHLYTLGIFITTNLDLIKIEKQKKSEELLNHLLEILTQYCDENFGSLKWQDQEVKKEHQKAKDEFYSHIKSIEERIFNETKINMIYPYPHEISGNQSPPKCSFLKLKVDGTFTRLEFELDSRGKELLQKQERLYNELQASYRNILNEIQNKLISLLPNLKEYIDTRKKLCLYYSLLAAKKKYNLTFAHFDNQIQFKKAELPALKKANDSRYTPLSLELKRGANVLFGANMTGKTSVLKTIYFQIQMTRFGLPIPASKAIFPYPENISFFTRNSGNTKNNLSSFGEELNFFCQDFSNEQFILVDELFHSTDPQSGIALSNIFLDFFKNKQSIFFCNSHYHEVLKHKDINLLKMKDSPLKTNIVDDLLQSIPFEIEPVSDNNLENNNNRTLELALHFPLPTELKSKIKDRIQNGNN